MELLASIIENAIVHRNVIWINATGHSRCEVTQMHLDFLEVPLCDVKTKQPDCSPKCGIISGVEAHIGFIGLIDPQQVSGFIRAFPCARNPDYLEVHRNKHSNLNKGKVSGDREFLAPNLYGIKVWTNMLKLLSKRI